MPCQTKKFLVLFAVLALVMVTASSGHVLAQSQPTNAANKTHVSASKVEVFGPSTNVTLMSTSMKTSANADLILSVSCECAISVNDVDNTFSRNEVDSALVVVKVWVEVDGVAVAVDPNAATPDDGRVIFCRRDSSNASATNFGSGFQEHQFEATRAAHAFNWFARNVGQGVHIVEVKAQVQQAASSFDAFGFQTGIVPIVQGAVGRRTLIVEPVLPGK